MRPGDVHDDSAARRRAAEELAAGLARAWEQGWQPADLVRMARRDHGRPARTAMVAAIIEESRRYAAATVAPSWAAQLEALALDAAGGDPPVALLRALTLALRLLPPQPRLIEPPGTYVPGGAATGPADEAVLERVRGLLAKAESTTFPSEAEAFTAKAQELMARYAIDRAVLDAAAPGATGPGGRRIGIDDPYATTKVLLLFAAAKANRCKAVWNRGAGAATLFGFPVDLQATELLFTSLLVQATAGMADAGRRDGAAGRRPAYRRSFLIGFAGRIGERLDAAAARAEAEAAEAHGAGLLPVLASRSDAVARVAADAFPTLRPMRVSSGDRLGYSAGRAAANVADLGVGGQLRRGA